MNSKNIENQGDHPLNNFKIPSHISLKSKKFMAKLLKDNDFDPHHFEILCRVGEAMDRADQAREVVSAEGLTVTDRYGTPKAHPAVNIERDARYAVLRGLRELGLDVAQEAARMPRTRDYGGRA
ncbi:P27 family phage terminase small subunit [Mesorhizobium sp. M0138]|uniref:P27 family phage terminase small subunit n=1 Tax=Mesorhizobium sp. M0138 TaxID=2956891 RepID=UPI003336FCAB